MIPIVLRTAARAPLQAGRLLKQSRSLLTVSTRPRQPIPLPHKSWTTQYRTMFIQTEATPNEDSLKFLPGTQILSSGATREFLTPASALVSPLAMSLFEIDGVRSVFYGPDFVTVSKQSDHSWALLKPEIFSIIMEHFTSERPLFKSEEDSQDEASDTKILDTDSETVAMIKELLETRVRPTIQEDGGDIAYMGFIEDEGIVKLSLKGSCRGCDSSSVTLKNGIERMLMHYIPEVTQVEQVTSPEDQVAVDEFAKFEERLRSEGKSIEM